MAHNPISSKHRLLHLFCLKFTFDSFYDASSSPFEYLLIKLYAPHAKRQGALRINLVNPRQIKFNII
jgi:hypothetical protein